MKSLLLIFTLCGAMHAMETELIEIKVMPNDSTNVGNALHEVELDPCTKQLVMLSKINTDTIGGLVKEAKRQKESLARTNLVVASSLAIGCVTNVLFLTYVFLGK